MKIVDIFAPQLYAFRFPKKSLDEYELALYQWTDTEYLKQFYETNLSFIRSNKYLPINNVNEFVDFISDKADAFDDILENASANENLTDYFEFLSKGKNIYELLPHKKSKFQVLRFYGIQLGEVIIIAGSAIKLTQEMDDHPDTKRQKEKLKSFQDFLRDKSINDEDSFFDYLSEQD